MYDLVFVLLPHHITKLRSCVACDDGVAGDDGDAAACHGNAAVDEVDAVDYDDCAAAYDDDDDHDDIMMMLMMMLIVSWCE